SSVFFFSSRRRHTRSKRDWSSDVCSSDLFSPLFYMGSIDLHRTSSFLRQLLLVEIALQFDYTRINFLTYKGIGFYFTLNIRSRCRRLSLSHSYSTRAERMQRSFMLL